MSREPYTLFKEVHVETAEEFLDTFTPHRGGHLYDRRHNEGWLFRGHANAHWTLRPSALRDGDPWLRFRGAQVDPFTLTDEQRMNWEETFVHRFADRASRLGYEVPFDSYELRDRDAVIRKHKGVRFPPPRARGLYALAQHYGVPTRLLDWSSRALVAAYFAAEGAVRSKDPKPERLAVWALHRGFVEQYMHPPDLGVDIVTVPQVSIPNLRSQSGLFTLVRYRYVEAMDASETPTVSSPPDLDILFTSSSFVEEMSNTPSLEKRPMLYKFTLPIEKARFLLHYLYLSGIDAASIYHGHRSIADAMQEPSIRSVCTPKDTALWRRNAEAEARREPPPKNDLTTNAD